MDLLIVETDLIKDNSRNVDPYWSYADPDPPYLVNADPDPGRIQDNKIKNFPKYLLISKSKKYL